MHTDREDMRRDYCALGPELYGIDSTPEQGREWSDHAGLCGYWSTIPEHAGGPLPGYGLIVRWMCPGCGENYPIRGEKIHMCFELAAARSPNAQQTQ